MVYHNVNFNEKWAAKLNQSDFIKHEGHHGLSVDQLKEAHKICVEAVKPPKHSVSDSIREVGIKAGFSSKNGND